MLKKIATLVGYKKAPKTTLFLKHPKKAAKALLSWKAAKMVAKRPVTAAVGAAVAVPVALLTYRKLGRNP